MAFATSASESATESEADSESESVADSVSAFESSAAAELAEDVTDLRDTGFNEELRSELDRALEVVRDLADSQREGFVNAVCDIIAARSEQEPSTAELYGVFGAIKQCFAEEALEESEPDRETEDDSYAPSDDSFDYALDAEDDIHSELQVGADSEIESAGEEAESEVSLDSSDYAQHDNMSEA